MEMHEQYRDELTENQRAVSEWLRQGPNTVHAVIYQDEDAEGPSMQIAMNIPPQVHDQFFAMLEEMARQARAQSDDVEYYEVVDR